MKTTEYLAPDSAIEPFDWNYYLPSFKPAELISPDLLSKSIYHGLDLQAAMKLQRFRDRVHQMTGEGLLVNHGTHYRRGVRSLNDQRVLAAKYGAAESFSHHCSGKAFDLSLTSWANYTPEWLANAAKEFHYTGIGLYKKNLFVHVDTRDSIDGKIAYWEK